MTEHEWAECVDPDAMLAFLAPRSGAERLFRLFAVACARRVWHLLPDDQCRLGIEFGESHIDGKLEEGQWQTGIRAAHAAYQVARQLEVSSQTNRQFDPRSALAYAAYCASGGDSAFLASRCAAEGVASSLGHLGDADWTTAFAAERCAHCHILRDLFGNPFRPQSIAPSWRDKEVLELARSIYDKRSWHEMPRLALALELVGCQDGVILAHCRQAGEHARGCWVIDSLLGFPHPMRDGPQSQEEWFGCSDLRLLISCLRDQTDQRRWRLFASACCRRIWNALTDLRSRTAVVVAERYAVGDATEDELICAQLEAAAASEEARLRQHTAEAEAHFCITPACCRATAASYAAGAALAAVTLPALPADPLEVSSDQYARFVMKETAIADMLEKVAEASLELRVFALESGAKAELTEATIQSDILRDIFGESFGPTGGPSIWLPSNDPVLLRTSDEVIATRRCRLPSKRSTGVDSAWLAWKEGTIVKIAREIDAEAEFRQMPILGDALEEAGCSDRAILEHCRRPGTHFRGCWVLDLVLGRD